MCDTHCRYVPIITRARCRRTQVTRQYHTSSQREKYPASRKSITHTKKTEKNLEIQIPTRFPMNPHSPTSEKTHETFPRSIDFHSAHSSKLSNAHGPILITPSSRGVIHQNIGIIKSPAHPRVQNATPLPPCVALTKKPTRALSPGRASLINRPVSSRARISTSTFETRARARPWALH